MDAIEEEKIRLERKKKELKARERLIREKEKQKRARAYKEIGSLAGKAAIDTLDQDALFGAFLELAERSKNSDVVADWKKRADEHLERRKTENNLPIIITYPENGNEKIKSEMKKSGFKWNSFRSEFYGYGCPKELEEKFSSMGAKIEVVEG